MDTYELIFDDGEFKVIKGVGGPSEISIYWGPRREDGNSENEPRKMRGKIYEELTQTK